MDLTISTRFLATTAMVLLVASCGKGPAAPSPPPATVPTSSSFTVTFGENPVPFRATGCNASVPGGWYTSARVQETSGVAFTPTTLTQKLDGSVAGSLAESFNSRFGACAGGTFSPGAIPGNGAVCASVGVCAEGSVGNYQFEISGTDANGHSLTFSSPVLQFGARSGQSNLLGVSSLQLMASTPFRPVR